MPLFVEPSLLKAPSVGSEPIMGKQSKPQSAGRTEYSDLTAAKAQAA